ncbi:hypothetical protein HN588_04765 [Candidatus Bathyarchaeota archaeon]|nr:hypothetical protein [Candidatus Bathyarchaeota archaeon]
MTWPKFYSQLQIVATLITVLTPILFLLRYFWKVFKSTQGSNNPVGKRMKETLTIAWSSICALTALFLNKHQYKLLLFLFLVIAECILYLFCRDVQFMTQQETTTIVVISAIHIVFILCYLHLETGSAIVRRDESLSFITEQPLCHLIGNWIMTISTVPHDRNKPIKRVVYPSRSIDSKGKYYHNEYHHSTIVIERTSVNNDTFILKQILPTGKERNQRQLLTFKNQNCFDGSIDLYTTKENVSGHPKCTTNGHLKVHHPKK